MTIVQSKVYSEVYSILNMLGSSYIEKLPDGVYRMIEAKRDHTYEPIYDVNININNQGISKETLAMITLFNIKCWANEEAREVILKKLHDNEKEVQREMEDRFEQAFASNRNSVAKSYETTVNKNVALTIENENYFIKLLNKIKIFFMGSSD